VRDGPGREKRGASEGHYVRANAGLELEMSYSRREEGCSQEGGKIWWSILVRKGTASHNKKKHPPKNPKKKKKTNKTNNQNKPTQKKKKTPNKPPLLEDKVRENCRNRTSTGKSENGGSRKPQRHNGEHSE